MVVGRSVALWCYGPLSRLNNSSRKSTFNLIREAKIHQIPSIMQTSVRDGMITMQKSLEELVNNGKIDPSAGKEH